jgi:hypothetical protein
MFTVHIYGYFIEPYAYLTFIQNLLPFINESQISRDELCDSGVISFWIELALREAEFNPS